VLLFATLALHDQALTQMLGCRFRLPWTRSWFDDGVDCNSGADQIGVVPQMGWVGVGREAHPASVGTPDQGSTLG
jgi:hypothetical protein